MFVFEHASVVIIVGVGLLSNVVMATGESVPFVGPCKDETAQEDCALAGDSFGFMSACFDIQEPICLDGKCNYVVKDTPPPFCCDPTSPSLQTTRQALKSFVPVRADFGPSPCELASCNPFDHSCPPCQDNASEPQCEEAVCSLAGVCDCVPIISRPDGCPDIGCGACPAGTVCDGKTGNCVECRNETDCPMLSGFCMSNRRCVQDKCMYDGCPEGHACGSDGTCMNIQRGLEPSDCFCYDEYITRFGKSCTSTLQVKSLTVEALTGVTPDTPGGTGAAFVKGLRRTLGVQPCCGRGCGSRPVSPTEALKFTFPTKFVDAEICLACVTGGDDGDDDDDDDDDASGDDDDDAGGQNGRSDVVGGDPLGRARVLRRNKGGGKPMCYGGRDGRGMVTVFVNGVAFDNEAVLEAAGDDLCFSASDLAGGVTVTDAVVQSTKKHILVKSVRLICGEDR